MYNYVSRDFSNDKWEFRLLRGDADDSIYKSFSDVEYGGEEKSHQVALAYSDKILSGLPKKVKARIRDGYPKFKQKSGVYPVTKNGIHYGYLAKVYNKFTGEIIKKSFSFGEIRSQDQAHKLAKKFRREQVKLVCQLAIKYGYSRG